MLMVRVRGSDCSIASRRYVYDSVERLISRIQRSKGKFRFGTLNAHGVFLSLELPFILRMANGRNGEQVGPKRNNGVQHSDEIPANFARRENVSLCYLTVATDR